MVSYSYDLVKQNWSSHDDDSGAMVTKISTPNQAALFSNNNKRNVNMLAKADVAMDRPVSVCAALAPALFLT